MTGATFTATILSNASALLPDQVSSFLRDVQVIAVTNGLPAWFPLAVVTLITVVILYMEFCPSPVQITHAKETNPIAVFDKDHQVVCKVPLDQFVKDKCKKLVNGVFYPSFFIWNGDLQTMYASIMGGFKYNKVKYERDILTMPDGGIISMDWSPKIDFNPDNKTPIVVILHGLTGGSHETYVQDLVEEISNNGYRSVVCNFRGCADTELKSSQLYSGAYTEDIRHATKFIQRKLPHAPLIAVGFSLGANILTKFVGEDGIKSPFIACIPIANPFDLLQGSHALHSTWIGRTIYSYKMTQGLIGVFKRHQHMLHGEKSPFDPVEIYSAKSLTEFDDAVTRRAFGFRTVHEYYRMGSSAQYIPDIRIPTLFLSALDDPIASHRTIPVYEAKANPNIILAITLRGGHIGWFTGFFPKRWFPVPVVDFIKAMFEAYGDLPAEHRHRFLESAHQQARAPNSLTPVQQNYYSVFMKGSAHNAAPTVVRKEAIKVKEQVVQTEVVVKEVVVAPEPSVEEPEAKEELKKHVHFDSNAQKVRWLERLAGLLKQKTDEDPHTRILRRAVTVSLSIALGYWAGRQRRRVR